MIAIAKGHAENLIYNRKVLFFFGLRVEAAKNPGIHLFSLSWYTKFSPRTTNINPFLRGFPSQVTLDQIKMTAF